MKPHFFVYEIFKREVVRRFNPMIDQHNSEWFSNNESIDIIKSSKNLLHDDSEDSSDSGSKAEEEQFFEDVSVFAVSPKGSFLVALVSNEFLVLKMLPRAVTNDFRSILTPSFMIPEHITITTGDEVGMGFYEEEKQPEDEVLSQSQVSKGDMGQSQSPEISIFKSIRIERD